MQEESQETDTERRRGMMKIEGEAVKGISKETCRAPKNHSAASAGDLSLVFVFALNSYVGVAT